VKRRATLTGMSYLLAFLGLIVLVILHEAGHFVAAKAVGMRVEKFSLFFGRMLVSVQRGETVYGIGWLPAGGYVKITGMNPHEELPRELVPRAYYKQAPWKRIVVILAGPFVNLVICFGILWAIFSTHTVVVQHHGQTVYSGAVVAADIGEPAKRYLRAGDRILAVDGHSGLSVTQISNQIASHRCPGAQTNGCVAATPVSMTVRRSGRVMTLMMRPRYDATAKRARIGFEISLEAQTKQLTAAGAAGHSAAQMWTVTSDTVSRIARLFEPKDRKQVHGIVGGYNVIQQEFSFSATDAFYTLALISLSLAVVNLFPFLPLDGGHVFWAVAEKVRGRRIPFDVMERASVVGFVLIIMLFFVGLTNDISTLSGKGFNVR
jgi:regulator of sigma E protease